MKKHVRLFLIGIAIICLGVFFVNPLGELSAQENQGTVCLYFDQTGRGDLSFNDMAYLGAERAANQFNLNLKYVTASSSADYLSDLTTLARTGQCDIIIGVGYLLADALPEAAKQFPDQKFAFVDGSSGGIPNVLGLLFKEQESSPPIGALAALGAIAYDYPAIGILGGIELPPVWRYEAGFRFGAHWALDWYQERYGEQKTVKILSTYVGRFDDPAGGKQVAETQLASGAFAIFGIAGASHLGAFDAVEEKAQAEGRQMGPPFAFGADAAQEYVKPGFIPASALKKVNAATYTAVKQIVQGTFEGGKDLELGLAQDGVGLSTLKDVSSFIDLAVEAGQFPAEQTGKVFEKIYQARWSFPGWVWEGVTELQLKIINGEIQIPQANTADQIKQVRKDYP